MELSIGKNILPIEVMDTPRKKILGMMGRKNLDGGMLFTFPNIKEQSFWMKNCLIPLDIIMMVDNQVTKIHRNCPPCKEQPCDSYRGNGNQVLELKGGESERLGIREGDILKFT